MTGVKRRTRRFWLEGGGAAIRAVKVEGARRFPAEVRARHQRNPLREVFGVEHVFRIDVAVRISAAFQVQSLLPSDSSERGSYGACDLYEQISVYRG
jgi:hypothetical protein